MTWLGGIIFAFFCIGGGASMGIALADQVHGNAVGGIAFLVCALMYEALAIWVFRTETDWMRDVHR